MGVPDFIIHLPVDGHLACFPIFFTLGTSALAVNMLVLVISVHFR